MATTAPTESPPTRGRPRVLDDPQTTTVTLERKHRDLLDLFVREHGLDSMSEAVREIIERHFNLNR